jgi:hypothetical protein
MSGMFYLANIFQLIIHRLFIVFFSLFSSAFTIALQFDNRAFSEQNLVRHIHQRNFHIIFNVGNELNAVYKEHLIDFFGNITFIS